MDEVREKETAKWDEADCDEDTLRTNNATAAGFNEVEILYNFDSTGKLIEVRWYLDSDTSSSASDADYEKLYKAFLVKYGAPLGYQNGECYIYSGGAFEAASTSTTVFKLIGGVGDIRDYAEWDITYGDDDHVKIELVQYYWGIPSDGVKYNIAISYNYFDDAELLELMQQKQQEGEAILNDI